MLKLPRIIAHRGAPKLAPENTIASFKKAVELGAKWVECDVQLTQDDVPIIFHDGVLDRTTNGKGSVNKVDYRDIEKLDAGAWFSKAFAGERVPRLDDFLSFAKQHNLGINVELKCSDGREKLLAEIVLENLKTHWSGRGDCLISSFNRDALAAVRQYDINIPLGFVCDYWNLKFISAAKRLDCFSMHVDRKEITRTVVEACRTNFLEVLAYTVDDAKEALGLLELGVLSIFSNDPGLL